MKIRICTKCKKQKLITEFYPRHDSRVGYFTVCKQCKKKQIKIYYQNHKEEYSKYRKEYYKKHKGICNAQSKKWRIEHSEECKEYGIKYGIEHRKELNEYQRNKRKIDINFKIAHNLRNRIWSVLKGNYKSKSTMKLIGCSLKFFKQYLQKQFKSGMNWNNYGKWHIDHIKPCCQFDLSKPKEQCKCFHYTNLQPLWEKENLSKKKF